MVPGAMPGEHAPDPDAEARLNVDSDHVHVVLTTMELDMIADALRSVGNRELADRLETILHQFAQSARRERDA
jgi:hypothetical protein